MLRLYSSINSHHAHQSTVTITTRAKLHTAALKQLIDNHSGYLASENNSAIWLIYISQRTVLLLIVSCAEMSILIQKSMSPPDRRAARRSPKNPHLLVRMAKSRNSSIDIAIESIELADVFSLDHFIDQTVGHRLSRRHEVVAIGIFFDLF